MTKFLNTRILLSGATILAAAALVVGATFAFFSDVETSEANAFTAGDVQVAISNLEHTYNGDQGNAPDYTPNGISFSLTDLKPLDGGQVSYTLTNDSNDAHVCAMVESTGNSENVRNASEQEAGDTTTGNPGNGNGELQNFISFDFGGSTGLLSDIDGEWFNVGVVNVDPGTANFAIGYCFGEYSGSNCVANGAGDVNAAQTDGMRADISFYAVQTRSNEEFDCASLNEIVIAENDLETASLLNAISNGSWFFYNDSDDTIMPIDQFFGSGGQNRIEAVDGAVGAKMVLHDASARYNIATYKYSDVKLADIEMLSYRIYDGSASSQTPYLHFNVDFDNSDTWQRRLVMVPTGVVANTWISIDAIDGGNAMWTYSGNFWPAGLVDNSGTTPGTTPRSWNDVLANYPNAETRSTDSFFGVRVGHPGPASEVGYVDWINFNGEVTNFEN